MTSSTRTTVAHFTPGGKQDTSIDDDNDLFFENATINDLSFPEASAAFAESHGLALDDDVSAEAIPGTVRVRIAHKWKAPAVRPLFGASEIAVRGEFTGQADGAVAMARGGVDILAKFGGRAEFLGRGNFRASWVLDEDSCRWEENGAAGTIGVGGNFNFGPLPITIPLIGSVEWGPRIELRAGAQGQWAAGESFSSWPSNWAGVFRVGVGAYVKGETSLGVKIEGRAVGSINGVFDQGRLGFGDPWGRICFTVRFSRPTPWGEWYWDTTYCWPGGTGAIDAVSAENSYLFPGEELFDESRIWIHSGWWYWHRQRLFGQRWIRRPARFSR